MKAIVGNGTFTMPSVAEEDDPTGENKPFEFAFPSYDSSLGAFYDIFESMIWSLSLA